MTLFCQNLKCQHELSSPVNFCPFCGTPADSTRALTNTVDQDEGSLAELQHNLRALKYCFLTEDITDKVVFAAACTRFIATEELGISQTDTAELLRHTEAAKQRILPSQDYLVDGVEEPIVVAFR